MTESVYPTATAEIGRRRNQLAPEIHKAFQTFSRAVFAARGADLLVLGSRGHGEFVGMLLGSVSEHFGTHAHCPVLVLRDQE